ncbi:MAG TPA: flagellin [Opitutaceae bacterium]|jgi:flagellin|nr:flagellin [Opitutaceae bacterium]
MAVIINTNSAANIAANNLNNSEMQLQESLNKLSSGSKIVNPSDDAGGLAVSMKLTATINREGDLENNISDATSFLQTQDGALQVAGSILDRMSQLETLYQDPTKNTSDQANYDDEFTQLQAELSNLSSATFNGVDLFATSSGQGLSVYTDDDLTSSEAVKISQQDFSDSTVGVGAVISSSVTSLGTSGFTLSTITSAIQNVATMRALNGAEQSRLNFASTMLTTNQTNLESAVSNITDVDVAQETTNLAKWNVLVQAGTSMLTQANQTAQVALKLITG